MDEKVMALAALDAAQKAADWAYWSMLGTWVSAIATFIAAGVALWAITGWRKHEEAIELRDLRVTAFNYHTSLIRAPEKNSRSQNEHDFLRVQQTYNALNEFYVSTLKMHSAISRGKVSEVYEKFADVQRQYIDGTLTNEEAEKKSIIHSSARTVIRHRTEG